MMMARRGLAALLLGCAAAALTEWHVQGQVAPNVTFERLLNAAREPQNWLTYWGNYEGTHFTRLDSIKPANAASLAAQWSYQFGGGTVETVPLVVDGLMFVTGPQNNAAALDARTGREIWRLTGRGAPPR